MKPDFTHASDSFKRRNPHLFAVGGLSDTERQPDQAEALDDADARRARRLGGSGRSHQSRQPTVTIVSFRRRLITDADNLIAGAKPLRDVVAQWLGVDDADKCVKWEYGQIQTSGREGTVVKVEV